MRPTRRACPVVESMESRGLLSAGGGLMGVHAPAASGPRGVALAGQVGGTYTSPFTNPDAGRATVLKGTGTLAPLGVVHLEGDLKATGFLAHGRASGTITLADTKGTVSLALTGAVQKGFSGLPTSFRYRIVGATGGDAGLRGTGGVDLTLTPAHGPTSSPGGLRPSFMIAEGFSLRFHR